MVKRLPSNGVARCLVTMTLGLTTLVACAPHAETPPDPANARRLWRPVARAKELAVMRIPRWNIRSATFSADGTRVVTASSDNTARIWEAGSGNEIAVLTGHGSQVRTAMFSHDGRRVVTTSYDETARVWDVESGKQLAVLEGRAWFTAALFSPDGTRIVTVGDSYIAAQLWNADTGKELKKFTAPDQGGRDGVLFSPDGKRIATMDHSGIEIWNTDGENEPTILKPRHKGERFYFRAFAFSPDGNRIVTACSDDNNVYFTCTWDVERGELLESMPLPVQAVNAVITVTFSPDGEHILIVGRPYVRTVHIWDGKTGRELMVLPSQSRVNTAVFSPDSTRILTASEDGTACLWDVKTAIEQHKGKRK